jgi:DNA-binding PadR family transcriptional regulator
MTRDQLAALRYTAKHAVCLSRDIGHHIGGRDITSHTASGRGSPLLAQLMRLGYVTREFNHRHKVYMYSITPRGQLAVLEHLPGLTHAE